MKIAPFVRAIEAHNAGSSNARARIEHRLVHTGQHYDDRMSATFFDELDIPRPDVDLGIGSGTHAEQVGRTMIAFENVLRDWRPDWVVVVGDVNATCACSITAKKEWVKLAHIEAGLRSFDLKMPEEINRMVTDRLSDLLFTPDELANANLRAEGVAEERIKFVGNIMIDTLEANRDKATALSIADIIEQNHLDCQQGGSAVHSRKVSDRTAAVDDRPTVGSYALMTMHRPSNVDERSVLEPIMSFLLDEIAADMPLIWPIHPRARKQLEAFGLWDRACACGNLILLEPLGYHEMLRLNIGARIMLTDSGGLQEECCVLGTPCLTLRWNTERPVTLREHGGASVLVGNAVENLRREYGVTKSLDRAPTRPPLWDGHTAERIVAALCGQ